MYQVGIQNFVGPLREDPRFIATPIVLFATDNISPTSYRRLKMMGLVDRIYFLRWGSAAPAPYPHHVPAARPPGCSPRNKCTARHG